MTTAEKTPCFMFVQHLALGPISQLGVSRHYNSRNKLERLGGFPHSIIMGFLHASTSPVLAIPSQPETTASHTTQAQLLGDKFSLCYGSTYIATAQPVFPHKEGQSAHTCKLLDIQFHQELRALTKILLNQSQRRKSDPFLKDYNLETSSGVSVSV